MSVSIAMPRMSTDPELTTAQSKYLESLARAGAEVHWVELSDPDAAVTEALTCDGLLLPGGGDMDPAFYGQERIPACGEPNLLRDAAEPKLLRAFLAADRPVLGICRGIQVMNVVLGGTLYQDVHACGLTDAAHQQKPPYDVVRQRVDIAPGSVLDRVLCDGAGEGMVPGCKAGWPASLETSWEGIAPAPHSLLVNTMHHQAIACVADPLQVSAVSGDGLVEGLEDPSRRFYLGVQWHPEYLDDNVPLFEALVAAAK